MKFLRNFIALVSDAIAFVRDPEARITSNFVYPSGNLMSIRDARKKGLM